jgi:FGGY-family pentulose kinase
MAVSREPRFIEGIWGPYFSAMVPGMWLSEGGQSATGALIDHIVFSHSCAAQLEKDARSSGKTVYELLNTRLEALSDDLPFAALLARQRHVLPYHHGNRSPRADASLRGMASGLRLNSSVDELALQYLATIQAIAYGTRHIIEQMNRNGYRIAAIFACGGGTKNPVFLREHADATGCRLVLPGEPEAVLLGAAILGAVASGKYKSVLEAMASMNQSGEIIEPARNDIRRFHEAKYRVFLKMYEDQMSYRKLMSKGRPEDFEGNYL